MPTGISEFEFSDLYLEPDGSAWAKRSPGDRERTVLTDGALQEAQRLRERIQEHKTGVDFSVPWGDMRLRIQRIETIDGDVFVCRKLMGSVLDINGLGFPPKLVDALLSESLNKGGVVLFTGSTGAGKSTSLGAWLAARLRLYGGTCWTVENPIEMRLNGKHVGRNGVVGTCYQTEVRNEEEIGGSIQKILRAAPNIIMVGEIRTAHAASQTVFAGTSGVLGCATFHANDIMSALGRIKNLLNGSELDSIADSLAAIIHQTATTKIVNGVTRRETTIAPLIVSGSRSSTAIRSHLRSGDFSQLVSEIERQKNVLFSQDAQRGAAAL